jgi:hypothetical protein
MSRSNLDLREALAQIPTEVLVQLERNYHADLLAFLPPRADEPMQEPGLAPAVTAQGMAAQSPSVAMLLDRLVHLAIETEGAYDREMAASLGGADAVAMLADRQGVSKELCPTCHHPVDMAYRGLCFGLVDGSSDRTCGCRAIGPDGKFYPDEVRA